MIANQYDILKFMTEKQKLRVPIYQRNYSWSIDNCKQFFYDLLSIGNDENNTSRHFIGSIIFINEKSDMPLITTERLIIDGQQRLTTINLIIAALSNFLNENPNVDIGINTEVLLKYYLINDLMDEEDTYKLILNNQDDLSLKKIINSIRFNNDLEKDIDSNDSYSIINNYMFFKRNINKDNAKIVYKGLSKLSVIYAKLDQGIDNPQLIFESLNSTGKDLDKSDLIRNYLLMGLPQNTQVQFYNEYWLKMENRLSEQKYSLFDSFIKDYLTAKLGRVQIIKDIYPDFKFYSKKFSDVEDLLKDLSTYANYYFNIVKSNDTNESVKKALTSLNDLNFDVTRPFLLNVYKDYDNNLINKNEFISILNLVETYVLRRNVSGIPTNSLNKTFANLYKEIDKENYLESFKFVLISKEEYKRLPTDEEFIEMFLTKNMYIGQKTKFILFKINDYHHPNLVVNHKDYTIEHIMPQNNNLSEEWKKDLGENWEDIHEKYLHNIGNLTLTAYNPKLSDLPFNEKKDIPDKGFHDDLLYLNRDLGELNTWNEELIIQRGRKLADIALEIWPYPQVSKETLNKYQSEKIENNNQFTLDDFDYIKEGSKMHDIFIKLEREILNLGVLVKEEPTKFYIAYKLKTNFLYIDTHINSLLMNLYINTDELDDPKQICNQKQSGCSFKITKIDELDYALFLIKQSYDYIYKKNKL